MEGVKPPEPRPAQLCLSCERVVADCWEMLSEQQDMLNDNGAAYADSRLPRSLYEDCLICSYLEAEIDYHSEHQAISKSSKRVRDFSIQLRQYAKYSHELSLVISFHDGGHIDLHPQFQLLETSPEPPTDCVHKYNLENSRYHRTQQYSGAAVQIQEHASNAIRRDRVAQSLREWLIACESSHQHCQHANAANWRPSRLLYIQRLAGGDVKVTLQEAANEDYSPGVRYMTLSHRWFSNDDFKLDSSNLAQFRSNIPLTSAKLAIRDAVWLCAETKVKYLWVDSLCILQDDSVECSAEIATMDQIYGLSVCTIAAAGAIDKGSSLFGIPHPLDVFSHTFSLPQFGGQSLTFLLRPDWRFYDRNLKHSVLSQRGWIFQERFLSPRTLYCCKEQLHWECRSERASEAFPEGISREEQNMPVATFGRISVRTLARQWDSDRTEKTPKLMMDLWARIVLEYTSCEMTFTRDRLRGLEGVIAYCRRLFRDDCIAGIWRSTLPQALLWRSSERKQRDYLSAVAPSWSWASVLSSIWHPLQIHLSEQEWLNQEFHVSEGEISDGQQSYLCRTLPAGCFISVLPSSERIAIHLKGRTWKTSLHEQDKGADWELDAKPAGHSALLFVPILSVTFDHMYGRQNMTSGLVLERLPHDVVGMLYRRLGTFTTPRTNFLAHFELLDSDGPTQPGQELSGGNKGIYIT